MSSTWRSAARRALRSGVQLGLQRLPFLVGRPLTQQPCEGRVLGAQLGVFRARLAQLYLELVHRLPECGNLIVLLLDDLTQSGVLLLERLHVRVCLRE